MTGKREAKRAEMRRTILQVSRELVRERGLLKLKARDVAAQAGCSVGSIYTTFEDLDDLILHINLITLHELDTALKAGIEGCDEPASYLEHLALAYLDFALENRNIWGALFEHQMSDDVPVPDWHAQEQTKLVGYIVKPLLQIDPSLSPEGVAKRAKAMFGSVHGIVSLSLQDKTVAIERRELRDQLCTFVAILVRGLTP